MASKGIIDINNTDSNGNTGLTIRVSDNTGVLLENINITGEDKDNTFTELPLINNPNESNSLTAYRSGRTCIIKAINLNLTNTGHIEGENRIWLPIKSFNDSEYKELFTPKNKNIFWYNEIVLLQKLKFKIPKWDTASNRYIETEQYINNPYHMSFQLRTDGVLYQILERELPSNTQNPVSNLNFTLTYLV